eukprot:29322_4
MRVDRGIRPYSRLSPKSISSVAESSGELHSLSSRERASSGNGWQFPIISTNLTSPILFQS